MQLRLLKTGMVLVLVAGLSIGGAVLADSARPTHPHLPGPPSPDAGESTPHIHWPNVLRIAAPANVDAGVPVTFSYRITGPIPKGAIVSVWANNDEGDVQKVHVLDKAIPAARRGTGTFTLPNSLWSVTASLQSRGPRAQSRPHTRAYSNRLTVYAWGYVPLSRLCDTNVTTNGPNQASGEWCKSGTVEVGGHRFTYQMYDPSAPGHGLYRPLVEVDNSSCTSADLQVAVLPASPGGTASPAEVLAVSGTWRADPGRVTGMNLRLPHWAFNVLDSSSAGDSAVYFRGGFTCFTPSGYQP